MTESANDQKEVARPVSVAKEIGAGISNASFMAQSQCVECETKVLTWIQLRPCKHHVCVVCSLAFLADRRVHEPSQCKSCGEVYTSIVLKEQDLDGVVNSYELAVFNANGTVVKEKDPIRYFRGLPAEKRKNNGVLSYTYQPDAGDDSTQGPRMLFAEVNRNTNSKLNATNESNLVKIMTHLHLTATEADKRFVEHEERVSKKHSVSSVDFERSAAKGEDSRLLAKLCLALGAGRESYTQDDMKNINIRASVMAAAVATDMLAQVNSRRVTQLQLAIASELDGNCVSENFKRLMSRWRLAVHPTTLRDRARKGVAKALKEGVEVGDYVYCHIQSDNLGWRSKAGYINCTIIAIVLLPEDVLVEKGFYNPDPSKRIPRDDGMTWDEYLGTMQEAGFSNEDIADSIVAVTKADIETLSMYILSHLDYILKLDLPDIGECQMIIDGDLVWEVDLKRTLGVELAPQALAVTTAKDSKTIYDMNFMQLDFPWMVDIATKDTVRDLIVYSRGPTERAAVTPNHPSGERPVQEIMNFVSVDGSPAWQYLNIRDEALSNGDEFPEKEEMPAGPFHTDLKANQLHGILFSDSFGYCVAGWRETEAKAKWIMIPGDPNDKKKEVIEYLAAQYHCAKLGLLESKAAGYKCSATEIHEHMLARAEEYPICMLYLVELRYVEITFLCRDSEKSGSKGDVELFLTALRLLLVYFTVSNSYKYTRLACEFLVFWKTSSSAQKVLFRNFFFTKLSANGRPIWIDRCMEWIMMHIRSFLGRHASRNHEAKMMNEIHRMQEKIKEKKELSELLALRKDDAYDRAAFNDSTVKVGKVFATTCIRLSSINLWSAAAPVDGSSVKVPSFIEPPSSNDVSFSLLTSYTLGGERAIRYFVQYYITTQNEVKRNDVDLSMIRSRASSRVQNQKKAKIHQLSNSPGALSKSKITKEELLEKIDFLRNYYDDIEKVTTTATREQMIAVLCQWRTTFFVDFPDMKSLIEAQLKAETVTERTSTRAQRVAQCQLTYFQLDEEVKAKFR